MDVGAVPPNLEIAGGSGMSGAMKHTALSAFTSLERTCFRVVALVLARLLGRDIRSEFERLNTQVKSRSYAESGVVLGGLMGLAVLATALGFWALCLLFVAMFFLFR